MSSQEALPFYSTDDLAYAEAYQRRMAENPFDIFGNIGAEAVVDMMKSRQLTDLIESKEEK